MILMWIHNNISHHSFIETVNRIVDRQEDPTDGVTYTSTETEKCKCGETRIRRYVNWVGWSETSTIKMKS